MRASVELAKDWRTDRMLRRLEAMLLVADRETTLIITGNGDVLEPTTASARSAPAASMRSRPPRRCRKTPTCRRPRSSRSSLTIAGELCIYTNLSHIIETLD